MREAILRRESCPPEGGGGGSQTVELLKVWVRTHFGISYTEEQKSLFMSRLEAFCREQKVATGQLLARLSAGDKELTGKLAESLSTNHTYFFREAEVLAPFGSMMLPALRGEPQIRVWSAACSGGDEPYSLAMIAADMLGPDAKRVAILGTDISQRMVSNAEAGIYPMSRLASIPGPTLWRHFRAAGMNNFVVAPETKSLCSFRRMNLIHMPFPFQRGFHIIFLRNVLYYFDPPQQRQILEACYDAALAGAWLVTSLTEPLHGVQMRWQPVQAAIYRKPGGRW
jgi:chemotaxis protein methyltransferase CheR